MIMSGLLQNGCKFKGGKVKVGQGVEKLRWLMLHPQLKVKRCKEVSGVSKRRGTSGAERRGYYWVVMAHFPGKRHEAEATEEKLYVMADLELVEVREEAIKSEASIEDKPFRIGKRVILRDGRLVLIYGVMV